MTTTAVDRRTQDIAFPSLRGEEVKMNIALVRGQFCPKATELEAFTFMRFCQGLNLNPFLRDAYLVKYQDKDPAQMIVGYHVWVQKASLDPNYDGFKAGIIMAGENGLEYRDSLMHTEAEKAAIVGGWCEVYHKQRQPVRVEVPLHEYIQRRGDGKPNRFWGDKPATMIQKVAIGQGFRFAFPVLFAGAYGAEEVAGVDEAYIVESTIAPAPTIDEAEPGNPPVNVDENGVIREETDAERAERKTDELFANLPDPGP